MSQLFVTRRQIVGLPALLLTNTAAKAAVIKNVGQLRDIDGGSDYYSQFLYPLPSDQSYFPIGVWLESVNSLSDVALDRDVGLDLYVGLTANSNLSLVKNNGMHAILQQSEWRDNGAAIENPAVVGWMLFDEIDMQQGPGQGYSTLNRISAQLPQDARMRYNNYGKGVIFWEQNEQAKKFVNEFQQIVSADVYWFTDPNLVAGSEGGKWIGPGTALTVDQTRRAANYGRTVDRMRELAAGSKPIWSFVEVGWPSSENAVRGGRAIEPPEIVAAVWHSIIAGARGIIYFNHSFSGPNPSQHCLREPAYAHARVAVRATNMLVRQLAPVLNAPFVDAFANAGLIRTMTKRYCNTYYVFAGATQNEAVVQHFSVPPTINGRATVMGENREIPIRDGRFSDRFSDGNAVHIYRIDVGD